MTTSTMSRRQRLRKLAYAPLVAAVAAGAICTGAGISTAAATDTPQSGNAYEWALLNHTGQSIYGNWSAEMAPRDKSRVETDKDHPWKPDDAAKAIQYQNGWRFTAWTGHICYNKRWWDFTYSADGFGDGILNLGIPVFTLEADSAGALFVNPHTLHFRRVGLTPELGVVC
ncbi:hypothetical protein [Rhodococcus jostii]|uniref:hypothetical protein n=1 Tax=Rhodococcus jostii TaxID=132919 RepID=UPI0036373C0A